ncbi:SIS domain-containing protein [Salinisphaera sp.]|uniref:SIS domain-containing protein n=1 Tax=Salinisphaera sp. TaxID=1914330 RepID=UPI002D790068|nr:SIS domain-containing protein [Salinisphaera sp.]HET7314420.1 SIS domain-containing protein [Salinisphaera sp.]
MPAQLDGNILEVIESQKASMRPSQRKVAERILEDGAAVLGTTLSELARGAGVSEPTVIRFCREIGCSGFRELKINLARSAAFGLSATELELSAEDSPAEVGEKIFDASLNSLDHCRRNLDWQEIDRGVDLLSEARHIEFFGYGASGIVAQDAQQKFALFGCTCAYQIDAHQQYIAASMLGPNDVAVAVSNTGTTRSVVEFVRTARLNGARVLAISGAKSPLLEQSDVGIVVETRENTELYTPTISRLAALIVIDILSTNVAIRRGPSHAAKIQHMKKGLAEMRALNL